MNRHVSIVLARLVATIGTVWIGFDLLLSPWRVLEADGVSRALQYLGVSGVQSGFGNAMLVVPSQGPAFLAVISPSCSALAAVLAFAAIAAFLVSGSVRRRLLAFVGAASLVMVANVGRISASLWFGLNFGRSGLVTFHDWVGTLIGIVGILVAFTLFLFLLLPSDKTLIREVTGAP